MQKIIKHIKIHKTRIKSLVLFYVLKNERKEKKNRRKFIHFKKKNINHNQNNSKMFQEILKMAKINRFSFSSLLSLSHWHIWM